MCGKRSRAGFWLLLLLLLVFSPFFSVAQDASSMTEIEIIEELLRNLENREKLLDERQRNLDEREQRLNDFEDSLSRRETRLNEREASLNEKLNSLNVIENSLTSLNEELKRDRLTETLINLGLLGFGIVGWIQ